MSKRIITRKPTGAELREMRDQRQSPGPMLEAARRAQSIRDGLNSFANAIEKMADAYNREDWKTLGYTSWKDYCEGEFGPQVRLSVEQRRQAAASLASAGLTKRAAAAALGVSHTTVQKDSASGNKLPLPSGEPQVRTDAEVADEVARATAAFDAQNSGDVDSSPVDVSGQDPSGDTHEPSSEVELPADSGTESLRDDVALVAGQPGTLSSLARDEPGPVIPVTQPSTGPVGEEPEPPPAAAGETFDSSAAQNLTEGSAPPPSMEPVLSLAADPGVAEAGDERGEVGEGSEAGQQGFSSTDPDSVIAWFETVADMGEEIDPAVLGPLLGSADIRRIERAHERISVVVRLLRERMGS